MPTICFILLASLLISSASTESVEPSLIKTFFNNWSERFKIIIDEGKETVDKVNEKIKTFARSSQIMLDENLPNNNDIAAFFKQGLTGTPFEITMNVFHAFCKKFLIFFYTKFEKYLGFRLSKSSCGCERKKHSRNSQIQVRFNDTLQELFIFYK